MSQYRIERCLHCHKVRSAYTLYYVKGNYYCSMTCYREHNNIPSYQPITLRVNGGGHYE